MIARNINDDSTLAYLFRQVEGKLKSLKDSLTALISGKVSKTGDTMTGDLVIKNTGYSTSAPPSSSSYRYVNFQDSAGFRIASVSSVMNTSEIGIQLRGQSNASGSTVQNLLGLYATAAGERRVSVTEKKPWLDALGITATNIASNANLNNLYEDGFYKCTSTSTAGSLSNAPSVGSAFSMIIMTVSTEDEPTASTAKVQAIFNGQYIWVRRRTTSSWGSWYRFTGTAV